VNALRIKSHERKGKKQNEQRTTSKYEIVLKEGWASLTESTKDG
jgi:hypothetical protein